MSNPHWQNTIQVKDIGKIALKYSKKETVNFEFCTWQKYFSKTVVK